MSEVKIDDNMKKMPGFLGDLAGPLTALAAGGIVAQLGGGGLRKLADGVNELTEVIQSVIKWNKDLEEKNHLLNLKILELKKMFSENDVNSLRKLDFSFNKLDLEINGQEQLSKLVPEGVNQGQKGSN